MFADKQTGAVAGDVATLRLILERTRDDLGRDAAVAVDTALRRVQTALDDGDLVSGSRAAERVRAAITVAAKM